MIYRKKSPFSIFFRTHAIKTREEFADPTADDDNNRLINALKELPSRPAPYVVHCMEGKDRTGYVCALLEGLCGATYDEIVADYLITYNNYYKITHEKDRDLCNTLVSLRLNTC